MPKKTDAVMQCCFDHLNKTFTHPFHDYTLLGRMEPLQRITTTDNTLFSLSALRTTRTRVGWLNTLRTSHTKLALAPVLF
jgi:hypothetical protein